MIMGTEPMFRIYVPYIFVLKIIAVLKGLYILSEQPMNNDFLFIF